LKLMRRTFAVLGTSATMFAVAASPSSAVVGGHDAPAGKYTSVAQITFGAFGCTGTLIAPTWVLTAGHCGSLTGGTGYGVPAAWPTFLIDVRVGGHNAASQVSASVKRAVVHPNYLLSDGYDITLLELSAPVAKTPTPIAGPSARSSWNPDVMETIAGWGNTSEGGSSPSILQEAQVPITTDAVCGGAYSSFDPATMVCAGYPEGGTDTCQGDSGGPMFATVGGLLRVVGATSFGNGCARPGFPGVYARVADATLSGWIKGYTPAGVGT